MSSSLTIYKMHLVNANNEPSTVAQYMRELEKLCGFLHAEFEIEKTQLSSITSDMLVRYVHHLHEKRLRASSINKSLTILRGFFGYLSNSEGLAFNPKLILQPVREKVSKEAAQADKHACFTREEVEKLLAYMLSPGRRRNNIRDCAIVALILGSGLRASEVCALNVSQFQEIAAGRLICLRKGGNWRAVHVAQYVKAPLEEYLNTREGFTMDSPLFVSTHGNRLTRVALWRSLAGKQKDLAQETGVHKFRHTLLTAVEHDADIGVARDVGGHKQVKTTGRYLHATPEEVMLALNSTPFASLLRRQKENFQKM